MEESSTLATTTSLCPDCLEQVPGQYEERNDGVFLTRECPDHGTASRQVWGSLDHWEWAADFGPDPEYDGGSLAVDDDHACLAVVEVTEDCNLSCSYCFASSGPGGAHRSTEEIEALLDTVETAGGRPIQFSGGEPTVRDDLPELVERARSRGIDHVEVNTNGIRLATEDGYARELADAGVTAIYLQFDGLTAETYEQIREVDLVEEKRAAIEACRAADLPVVLVPTVVPDVNTHEMGDIVRFALDNRDIVRSVNFQPVAHFGRYENNDGRFAIDDATRLLAEQMETLEPRDMLPAPCCSAYCQIGTAFVPRETAPGGEESGNEAANGEIDAEFVPLTSYVNDFLWDTISGMVDEEDYMELLAGTAAGEEWACKTADCCGVGVPDSIETLFEEVVPVSFTGFMDADAADVNRLSNCCISVPTTDGELVPFCGYNMTTEDGEYALRNRNDWGGRTNVEDPPGEGYQGGGEGIADGGRDPADDLETDRDNDGDGPDGFGCCDGGGCC
jgi:uncharacterized radical SAM superfamily Fe-S cluster-containing enzyme